MPLRININDEVAVRLTEHGRQVIAKHYAAFGMSTPEYKLRIGVSLKFQLHELMRIFGPDLGPCFLPVPFVGNEIVLLREPATGAAS